MSSDSYKKMPKRNLRIVCVVFSLSVLYNGVVCMLCEHGELWKNVEDFEDEIESARPA